jgi:hypothetical protein
MKSMNMRELYSLLSEMPDTIAYEEWLEILKQHCKENDREFESEDAIILFETVKDIENVI